MEWWRCFSCPSQLFVVLIILVQMLQTLQHFGDSTAATPNKTQIQLLLLLHFPAEESHGMKIWDRGQEILPAAQLAVEEINANSTILPEYSLQLSVTSIERCVEDKFASNYQALVPFTKIASESSSPVLGMVGGPFCPPLLDRLISPLSSREQTRLFQLSGSTAATVREERNAHLNFITPSIELYYQTVYAMMREFNWTRIFVIAESFFKGATKVAGSAGLNITFRQFSPESPSLFSELRLSRKNIIFASVDEAGAAELLCGAEQGSLVYPDYVWIFHDVSPALILDSRGDRCELEELERAINGSFFLQFPFRPESANTTLVSGQLYSEYFSEYKSLLSKRQETSPYKLDHNPYANILYDSVWAFALALDMATGQVLLNNSSLPLELNQIILLMDQMLPNISFEGASGSIDFENKFPSDLVQLYHVLDGVTNLVGTYKSLGNVTIEGLTVSNLPSDDLPRVYILIPVPLTAVLLVIIIMCFILTTVVLALFIYYREDSEIKATSPNLSYLMFSGCYLLFSATLLHVISGAVVITGAGVPTICGAIISGNSLGVNLIFTTLLLRMLRVYRIFSSFGKTGKFWSNRNMACLVGVVVLCDVALIVVWGCVDTFRIEDVVTFRPDANPPHYQVHQYCHSQHLSVWLGLVLGKLGLLFAIVLCLAIKTRKIRRSNFKDTKKVNVYIFVTIMIVITHMSLYFLFKSTNNAIATHLMVYLAFATTGLLCQLFLFVPKVTTPILKKFGYEVTYEESKHKRVLSKRVVSERSRSVIALALASHYTEVI